MRFAVARHEGLSEELAGLVDQDYETSELSARHKLVIRFADALLASEGPAEPTLVADLRAELDEAEIGELAAGLALFHGFSKLLIALGLEPDDMPTSIHATPDVPR